MKIDINKIKVTPPNLPFNFCVFGDPNNEIKEWINYWNLKTENSGKFTNILIGDNDLNDLFEINDTYKYMDGFSPNLNKYLHVGHISNLTIASALQNLGISINPISILGDTLEGDVDPQDTFNKYKEICELFNYKLGDIYYASKMKYNGDLLKDGEGDYKGTKIFDLGEEKIVGIKSDGSTSYFYQDVALASYLNDSTLYLTGFEQDNHFKALNKLFPKINHIGLGLVMIDNKKMSSSEGNVIFAQDMIDYFVKEFEDEKVAVNVLMGQILKSKPESVKKIDTKNIKNAKNSPGLYLSYTMARLKSAGMIPNDLEKFNSNKLKFAYLKTKALLSPNILLESLVNLCKEVNTLYLTHIIKDNTENQKMFQPMLDDLELGVSLLGMYSIDKVN